MTDKIREAVRTLDECCRLRKPCIYGANSYTFSSYDVRKERVFIDMRAKDKTTTSTDIPIESLPAFMERALQPSKSNIPISISDLEIAALKRNRPSKNVDINAPVVVWMQGGAPGHLLFSYWLTDELKKVHPVMTASVSFNKRQKDDDRIYVLLTSENSTKFVKAKRGRVRLRCTLFADKIRYRQYDWSFSEIEGIKVLILTPDKDTKI